jgi:electron transport complex protein RnfB
MLIASSVIVISSLGILFGIGLGIASKKLHIEHDEKVEMIMEILPGANCGACGQPGCMGYAENIVLHDGDISLCSPGGQDIIDKIADIMGKETVQKGEAQVAHVMCKGDNEIVKKTAEYPGIKDCNAANMINSGNKECPYGCLGYGSCATICKFNAIIMSNKGLPIIDEEKCTACGECVDICPKNIISLIPKSAYYFIECSSQDKGPRVRKYCKVGCISCTICVKQNEGNGIEMKDNLPEINYAEFKGDKTTAEKCPPKTISVR